MLTLINRLAKYYRLILQRNLSNFILNAIKSVLQVSNKTTGSRLSENAYTSQQSLALKCTGNVIAKASPFMFLKLQKSIIKHQIAIPICVSKTYIGTC